MLKWRVYWVTQITLGVLFRFFNIISRCTFGLFLFKLTIVGREHIRNLAGPLIVTPNHKSYADHFFILASLPVRSRLLPARGMAADWLFKIPVIRWVLKHLLGAYPTRRGQGLDISLRDPLRVLQKGAVVAIYPEGGIRYAHGVHPVKIGAAYLAKKTGSPILPVAIRGIEYLSWKAFFFGRRRVEVVFGEPFVIDQNEDLVEASEKIRKKIEALYN